MAADWAAGFDDELSAVVGAGPDPGPAPAGPGGGVEDLMREPLLASPPPQGPGECPLCGAAADDLAAHLSELGVSCARAAAAALPAGARLTAAAPCAACGTSHAQFEAVPPGFAALCHVGPTGSFPMLLPQQLNGAALAPLEGPAGGPALTASGVLLRSETGSVVKLLSRAHTTALWRVEAAALRWLCTPPVSAGAGAAGAAGASTDKDLAELEALLMAGDGALPPPVPSAALLPEAPPPAPAPTPALRSTAADPFNVGLEMDLLAGGDLFTVVAQSGHALNAETERQLLTVFGMVAAALDAVHARGVAHLDLALDQVVFADEARTAVRLVGFSSARLCDAAGDRFVRARPYAAAPEQCHGLEVDARRADMWALGSLLFGLLAREYPVTAPDEAALAALGRHLDCQCPAMRCPCGRVAYDDGVAVVCACGTQHAPCQYCGRAPSYSPFAKALLRALMQRDPRRRISAGEVLHVLDRFHAQGRSAAHGLLLEFEMQLASPAAEQRDLEHRADVARCCAAARAPGGAEELVMVLGEVGRA